MNFVAFSQRFSEAPFPKTMKSPSITCTLSRPAGSPSCGIGNHNVRMCLVCLIEQGSNPGWLASVGNYTSPLAEPTGWRWRERERESYTGVSHYKGPYQPTSIVECHKGFDHLSIESRESIPFDKEKYLLYIYTHKDGLRKQRHPKPWNFNMFVCCFECWNLHDYRKKYKYGIVWHIF